MQSTTAIGISEAKNGSKNSRLAITLKPSSGESCSPEKVEIPKSEASRLRELTITNPLG